MYTWRDMFVSSVRDMPTTDLVMHDIPTFPHARPKASKMPLFTERERRWQEENLPKLIQAQVLAFCRSPWSAKPKFVAKKVDDLRMVNVFCSLNAVTIKDAYPMRRLEPILEEIGRESLTVFFQADAANGYYAVVNNPDDAYKTAFPSIHGQLCYLRMGQGLAGAPRTYSKLKDIAFGPIPGPEGGEPPLATADPEVVCQYFMDDDLGGARNFKEMFNFLHHHYFPRLSWAKLTLSPAKCEFFTDRIHILGFDRELGGLRPNQKKRDVMLNYPPPRDEKELDAFLYLLPYVSDCIPGRADLATTMKSAVKVKREMKLIDGKRRRVKTDLGFDWTTACQQAFDKARIAIMENVITGADPNLQYHLATDASGTGLGGVLVQLPDIYEEGTSIFEAAQEDHKLVKFLSFGLSETQRKYSNTEREFLALLTCLEKVRHLVLGSKYPVVVYTDHSAILDILRNADNGRGRVVSWQYKIGEFNLSVRHVPGRQLGIADGLSRLREMIDPAPDFEHHWLQALCVEADVLNYDQRWNEWMGHMWYGDIVQYKLLGEITPREGGPASTRNAIRRVKRLAPRFRLIELPDRVELGYIEKNGKTSACLRTDEQIEEAKRQLHDVHGHFAANQTISQSIGRFYWPTRAKELHEYARTCHECQLIGPLRPSAGLAPVLQLQPLDLMGFDYLGPISPMSKHGNRYILVAVDYFSRYGWAMPTTNATSKATLEKATEHIFSVFGYPRALYTDNGSHFTGGVFPREMERKGVKMHHPPPAAPSSVGLSEAYVKLVKTGLQAALQKEGRDLDDWDLEVPAVIHGIDTRFIFGGRYTPSELLFGFNPQRTREDRTIDDELRSTYLNAAIIEDPEGDFVTEQMYETRLARMDEIRDMATRLKLREQERIEAKSIESMVWEPPSVGDLVLLRRYRLDQQRSHKLEARYIGPYKVTAIAYHGKSATISNVKDGLPIGTHHINNLKMYLPRENVDLARSTEKAAAREQEWAIMESSEWSNPEEPGSEDGKHVADPFLRGIMHINRHAGDADEKHPAYWVRKAVTLRH